MIEIHILAELYRLKKYIVSFINFLERKSYFVIEHFIFKQI